MTTGANDEHDLSLLDYLKALVNQNAESLHLSAGRPASLRVKGELFPLKSQPLTPGDIRQLVYAVLPEGQKSRLEKNDGEFVSTSFGVKGFSRFTLCAFWQRGALAATFHTIPFKIPETASWLVPSQKWLTGKNRLCVVAGNDATSRSLVLAQWVDHLNTVAHQIIVTFEFPLSFVHPQKNSAVNQVEFGADLRAENALRLACASSADTICVDVPDGLSLAVDAWRAGHTVLTTLPAATVESARATLGTQLRSDELASLKLAWVDSLESGKLL